MDLDRFNKAKKEYKHGNYAKAAREFLDSAEAGIHRGNGEAFYYAGNSLAKLGRHSDAITVYDNALKDDANPHRGVVLLNKAISYVRLEDAESAATAYELAIEEPDFTSRYKAYQGLAQCYMQIGRLDEAAKAYKGAALDPENPHRDKALVNLGLCLMSLGQYLGAVEAFRAALSCDDCAGIGNIYANMGVAYDALGNYRESVAAFESARGAGYTAFLSHEMQAFDRATLGRETQPVDEDTELPADEISESVPVDVDSITIDNQDPDAIEHADGYVIQIGNEEDVASYFARSESEIVEQGREMEKLSDKPKYLWKIIVAIILVLAILAAGVYGAYYYGLGYPMASDVVTQSLTTYNSEGDLTKFWITGTEDPIRNMALIPTDKEYKVDSVDARLGDANIIVSVTGDDGTDMKVRFHLVRDGISWIIDEVSNEIK